MKVAAIQTRPRIRILLAVMLTAMCQLALADMRVPPFERVELANGTVLLLMERHEVPLISFKAVLRGGALTDPVRQPGMSSLLAAMLEKGAGSRDAFAFADALADVGATMGAYADAENITIRGSFLARDRTLMIELLNDMLQRPHLPAGEFEALRARHIEFIRAAKDSDLASLVEVYGRAAFFKNHPYGRPVMGSEAGLAAIAHGDLQRHYQAYLGADRLILAVTGDFKMSQMKQALSRAFAGWRKAGAPLPRAPAPLPPDGRRVLLVDAPDSVQSYFWLAGPGVARDFAERAPLDVVNTVFGGRFTSMLNSELRVRSGLSYGAGSGFERFIQPGDWNMSSFTRTQTTAEAIDLALAVLDTLHEKALDPEQLASGRSYVQGQFPLALETPRQWANVLADLEFYELRRDYIDGYGAAVAAVTEPDAERVIRMRFPNSHALTLVVIGNATAIRDSLRKYGPLTEMKLSDPTFQPE